MPPANKDTPSFDDDSKSSDKDLESRIRDLEVSLAAAQAALPTSLIPRHGAGVDMTVAPSWSQAEQEDAKRRFP